MSHEKYLGMDVHQAPVSTAVMDIHGKVLMKCLLETKASTIVDIDSDQDLCARWHFDGDDRSCLLAQFQGNPNPIKPGTSELEVIQSLFGRP